MRMWPDCVPCILGMTVNLARDVGLDDTALKDVMRGVLAMGFVRDGSSELRAPLVVADIWARLVALAGNPDPLRSQKDAQNEAALGLLPLAEAYVSGNPDPLAAALKLGIAGNVLDTMVGPLGAPDDGFLEETARRSLDPGALEELRRRLRDARTITYLTDNCGEIVFDGLLIETIQTGRDVDITVVMRGASVINDATLDDAVTAGLLATACVVGNGDPNPLPSTMLSRVSPDVRRIIEGADLVISKGGANFELLEEEAGLAGKVTFLMHAKCHPLCSLHRAPPGGLILCNR